MKVKQVAQVLFLFLLFIPTQTLAASNWDNVADEIGAMLDESFVTYQKGEVEKAKTIVDDAYFGPFEGEQMEQAIRINISSTRAFEIEEQFSTVKNLMRNQANSSDISAAIDKLKEMLQKDASILNGNNDGKLGAFLYSLSIMLREGFEAILIIGALIGYLVKSGNEEKVNVIYYGSGIAIFMSLVTAFLLTFIFSIGGKNQEVLEGITILVAVAVLFWVSYWLISKVQGDRWQRYIEEKLDHSLTKRNMVALGAVAFLAVYREGAETVLFYIALFAGSETNEFSMIITGLIIGVLLLIVLFYIVRFTSKRIPLKPFFIVTGSLMYVLAFIFAGDGVKELQAAGWISVSKLEGFPTIGWLGMYPTWESLSLQFILIGAAIIPLFLKIIKKEITINR